VSQRRREQRKYDVHVYVRVHRTAESAEQSNSTANAQSEVCIQDRRKKKKMI